VKGAMYEFAYNDVIEDSHKAMRAREQAAMDRVIGMLRAAQEKGPQSRERVDALFYLRRLWMIFIDDLNDPNNELPDQLRAGIISIGLWMMKEIDRVREGLSNDLTPMIEINELIRDGLK
jgi:flagellar biosynthesis activator protein FlaF